MSVRAKFHVSSIEHLSYNKDVRIVKLSAVSADGVPENERYHKYTPQGEIKITIDNPPASDQFELGKTFYVDFTEVVRQVEG